MFITLFHTIINPPKAQTIETTGFDSKYILAYRMCLFLSLTLSFLNIVLYFYFDFRLALITSIALLFVVLALLYIRKTGTYFVATLTFNIIGSLACQAVLFGATDQPHIADPLWMIINILFAFLVLGNRWGLFLTLFHGTLCTLFFFFFFENQLDTIKSLNDNQLISTAINILICFSIIGYLGWQNIRTNDLSKAQLNNAQDVLQEQYNIISKQNEEKTVMLKEIHHRVKNNLQIITSLLRLQSRELENPEAIAKFKDATHRVIAMSMIHEKMYQSDHLSTLHLREYLHDLSTDLVSSYQSGYPVDLKIECDVESIGLRSIVPLALILNELISNSLKYAFDDYDNCLISISFMRSQGTICKLIYKDSGTWKAPTRQGSFGLDLIESLSDQLEGTFKTETYPETIFEISFSPQED